MYIEGGRVTASGDSETKGRLRVEEVTGESLGGLLWLLRKVVDRKGVSQGGAALVHLEVREKGSPRDRVRWLAQVRLPLPSTPLAASLLRTLRI